MIVEFAVRVYHAGRQREFEVALVGNASEKNFRLARMSLLFLESGVGSGFYAGARRRGRL